MPSTREWGSNSDDGVHGVKLALAGNRKVSLMAWALVLMIVVCLTNRYPTVALDHSLVDSVASDGYSYLAIAEAAPGFPATRLPFHHSQRFLLPYVIGLVSHPLHADLNWLFQLTAVALEVAILWNFCSLLIELPVGLLQGRLIIALLVFNPWAFRFYLAFPVLSTDLAFILGSLIVIRGLNIKSPGLILLGQVLASVSRQTGLLLVPMIGVWLWWGGSTWDWRHQRQKWVLVGSSALISVFIYAATVRLASPFSHPNRTRAIVFDVGWLAPHLSVSIEPFVFFFSLILPAIPLIAVALAGNRIKRITDPRVLPLATGALLIWLQPFLSGPGNVGGNGPRLVALASIPVLTLVALRLQRRSNLLPSNEQSALAAVVFFLFLTSLHHIYSVVATLQFWGRNGFTFMYLGSCLAIAVICWIGARRSESNVQTICPVAT